MLIDGRKVLYSIKSKKLVNPEIPTEGLVCYLDARGKTNNDKHKGTLIDLSGNGNHGTLQNFNFTEDSGYVKDLSGDGASGLKFDGVDDSVLIPLNAISNSEITIYIKDLELNRIPTSWSWVLGKNSYWDGTTTGFGLGAYMADGTLHFNSKGVRQPLISENVGRPIKANTIVVSIKPGAQKFYVDGQLINTMNNENGYVDNTYPIYIGRSQLSGSSTADIRIGQVGIWNRALSDTEIQQLLTD